MLFQMKVLKTFYMFIDN